MWNGDDGLPAVWKSAVVEFTTKVLQVVVPNMGKLMNEKCAILIGNSLSQATYLAL